MICTKKRRSVNQVQDLVKGWFEHLNIKSVKFDHEFEGMETPVALVVQNRDEIHGSIASALSRACSRLIIVSSKGDEFLENAVTEGLLNDITKEDSHSFNPQDASNDADMCDESSLETRRADNLPKKEDPVQVVEINCCIMRTGEEEMNGVLDGELNDKTRMDSCVQYIRDYIGNRISDSKIEQIILKFNFDTEKALDDILLEVTVDDDSLSSGSWEKFKFLGLKEQEADTSSMPNLTVSDGDFSSESSPTRSSSSLSSDHEDNNFMFDKMSSLNDINVALDLFDLEKELDHLQSLIYRPNSLGDLSVARKTASEIDLTSISLGNSRCVSPNLVGPPSPKFYRRQLEHLDLL